MQCSERRFLRDSFNAYGLGFVGLSYREGEGEERLRRLGRRADDTY
ncbi:hypothetical protein IFM46972_08480 [Aspergillus udagawae]|uniref:Uncharacterized protein n=1 Tax=Aspergillus udagawae TaxID=91492 RepID=A0A8H3S2T5_9EURO|nr:hypothetical protein IFM46972_08480 [Aspergillus udagawae]